MRSVSDVLREFQRARKFQEGKQREFQSFESLRDRRFLEMRDRVSE